MELIDRAIEGKYWVVYYVVYVVGIAVGVPLFWPEITSPETAKTERLFLVAAIFGIAAGSALLSVIIVEVTGRMVLLIPDAWRKLKATSRAEGHAEGHAEGLSEGRAEGRAAEKDRIQDIIAHFGRVDPDTGAITLDTDAQYRLRNGVGEP